MRLRKLFLASLVVLASAGANAGVIVVAGDEWPLSGPAFSLNTASTETYATNLAHFLVGSSGSILNTSNYLFSDFGTHVSGLGYSYTEDFTTPFGLTLISGYDAIMVGGVRGAASIGENLTTLTSYVNAGGSVYVFGGTGQAGSAVLEAADWNPFTTLFGITLSGTYTEPAATVDVTTDPGAHPLRSGVGLLTYGFGHDVTVTGGAVIALRGGPELSQNIGMIATAVPEPSKAAFLLSGVALILWAVRRRRGKGAPQST